jgi:hypothetical protein
VLHRIQLTVTLALMAGALALVAGASARTPVARAAGSCGVGAGHGYGYSYLTSLQVYRTSCATGRTVARHHGHVRGWRCSRKILDRSPVQYDAHMTCGSGRRQVKWTYTQNT